MHGNITDRSRLTCVSVHVYTAVNGHKQQEHTQMTATINAGKATMNTAVNVNSSTVQRLDTVTKWLMAFLILVPFLISFGSLWGLAGEQGISWPMLYPLMVDGGLLVFKLLVLSASMRGESDWYSWAMAGALTVISVGLNVAHVPAGVANVWLARFMFGLPPALILLAFIAVTRRIESQAKRETAVMSIEALQDEQKKIERQTNTLLQELATAQEATTAAQAEMEGVRGKARELNEQFKAWKAEMEAEQDQLAAEVERLETRRESLRVSPITRPSVSSTAVSGDANPEDILSLVQTDPDISQAGIARELDMSPSWVSKHVKSMKKEGLLSRNGHGWEIHS
jgi:biotin operon repressor